MPTKRKSPTDAIEAFFTDISTRGQIPMLGSTTGTIRFELTGDDPDDVDYWFVTITKGEVVMTRKKGKADASVRSSRKLVEEMAKGRTNPMAAVIRGALVAEGDLGLIISFQRLFPGKAGSTGHVPPITEVEQNR